MKPKYTKNILIFGIIISFVSTSVTPASTMNLDDPYFRNVTSFSNTLYVGGSGPNNYTKIQNALEDAVNGDTIFVYNGTYHENLVVNKVIRLIGENKNSTIIDGNYNSNKQDVIILQANNILIENFTIKNSYGYPKSAGIKINSPFCVVKNCKIYSCRNGIFLNNTNSCLIENSVLCHDSAGILLDGSSNNTIINCTFYNDAFGIEGYNSFENRITNCLFHTNNVCVFFSGCNNNVFDHDTLVHNNENGGGIYLKNSHKNNISQMFIGYNNGFGITLDNSSCNKVVESQFYKNQFSIEIIKGSSNNLIMNCNFSKSFFGIDSYAGSISFSNKIRYNNFCDNLYNGNQGGSITNFRKKDFMDVRYNWWGSLLGPSRLLLRRSKYYYRGGKVGMISEIKNNLLSFRIFAVPWETKPIPIDFDINANVTKYTETVDMARLYPAVQDDSDSDGCPDWWETKYGYNPYIYDTHKSLDTDSDGLNNVEEYLTDQWDSNPFKKDIFIEVDWLHPEDKLSEKYKKRFIDIFEKHDITLHIDDGCMGGGEQITCNSGKVLYNQSRDLYWKYFLHEDPAHIRKGIFHYVVICSKEAKVPRGGYAFFGWDNLDSFIINAKSGRVKIPFVVEEHIAISVLHELGHTLGLFPYVFRGVDVHYRFTYLSCMNYNYVGMHRLDYSDGTHGRKNSLDDFDDWSNLDLTFFENSHWEEPFW